MKTLLWADVEPLAFGIADWHAKQAPVGDSMIVFRDSAFEDDVAKTNCTAILAAVRPQQRSEPVRPP